MRRNFTFNPNIFHQGQPLPKTQEQQDSASSSQSAAIQPAAGQSSGEHILGARQSNQPGLLHQTAARPLLSFWQGGLQSTANAASSDERLKLLDKAVLADFRRRIDANEKNTLLAKDYACEVLEEVAEWLYQHSPLRGEDIRSLADVQRKLNLNNGDAGSNALLLRRLSTSFLNTPHVVPVCAGGIHKNNPPQLQPIILALSHWNNSILPMSTISRQGERLIHQYRNYPEVLDKSGGTVLALRTIERNSNRLKTLSRWLDEKKASGQPAMHGLDSLQKIRHCDRYADIVEMMEHDYFKNVSLSDNAQRESKMAILSFWTTMGPKSAPAPVAASAPVTMPSIQRQLLLQFGAEARLSSPPRQGDMDFPIQPETELPSLPHQESVQNAAATGISESAEQSAPPDEVDANRKNTLSTNVKPRRKVKRDLQGTAATIPTEQEQAPKTAARKSSTEKRRAAEKEKRQAGHDVLTRQEQNAIEAGFITAQGTGNTIAHRKHKEEQAAIKAGFVTAQGAGDVTAHRKHKAEETALKAGFITAQGTGDVTAHRKHKEEKAALKAGFITMQGTVDTAAYKRYLFEQIAIKAGFITAQGTADTAAYRKHLFAKNAIKAGFITTQGTADLTAYFRHMREQTAIKAGFVTAQGTPDTAAYKRHKAEQAAIKAGFITAQSTADLTAYYRHMHEQDAIKAGFITAQGTADTAAYKKHLRERTAIKAGFVTAQGAPDTAAYKRHLVEQAAKNYTDAAGNRPYVKNDGSVDVAGYKKNVSQQRQEEDEANLLAEDEDLAWRMEHDNDSLEEDEEQLQAMASSAPQALASTQACASSSRKRPASKPSQKSAPKRRKKNDAAIAKQELAPLGSAFPAPVAGIEASRINTAQISHVPTTSYALIDLSDEGGPAMQVFTVRHTSEMIVSSGKQLYEPALDKLFPIRDPAHPEHVHPDYADPDDPSRCSPKVVIQGINFYKTSGNAINENNLWQYAKAHFKDLPFKRKTLFIEALKRSCHEELTATMKGGEPPSSRQVKIEEITQESQCDSPEEFKALENQYGGFLRDYEPSKQPSLRNGKIVCMFAGARLTSDEDDQQYMRLFGSEFSSRVLKDYAANTKKYGERDQVTWAPYGGGNMGQYFNSSFKPDAEGKLVVDAAQANAFFCPVMLDLTDHHGNARKESMLLVVQHRPIAEGKQIKLNYGDSYTLEAGSSQSMESSPAPLALKQEVE